MEIPREFGLEEELPIKKYALVAKLMEVRNKGRNPVEVAQEGIEK